MPALGSGAVWGKIGRGMRGQFVIQYRTFRNADPPGLVHVWNESCTGRGAAFLTSNLLFEYFLLAKPFFDPAGLIIALDDKTIIGFGLAGFGPNTARTVIDKNVGVVCALAVLPPFRRRGVGSELLSRCEAYLRERGARELYAGPQEPLNPFTLGIYGGCNSPGFLASDGAIHLLLEKRGYQRHRTSLVFQRSLETPLTLADSRFAGLRQRYDLHTRPQRGANWWEETVLGLIELHEYRLQQKGAGTVGARLATWEMELYRPRWNEHAIGILDLEVAPQLRRQGLAKFVLAGAMRHLHDQFFTLAEVHVATENAAALVLVRSLGFNQVDAGHSYKRH